MSFSFALVFFTDSNSSCCNFSDRHWWKKIDGGLEEDMRGEVWMDGFNTSLESKKGVWLVVL